MSYNKIFAKKTLDTMLKDGATVIASANTEASQWERPDLMAEAIKDPLTAAIQKYPRALPAGTVEVCARESEHPSPGDARDHTSVHFPTK